MAAFGKDKSQLHGSFLQRAKRSMNKPKRGGGGGAPYFINRYKPPTQGSDMVRILPGNYPVPVVDEDAQAIVVDSEGQPVTEIYNYFQFTEHFHGGRKKSSICSAGPLANFKGKAAPCHACTRFWWEWEQRQANDSDHPKSMSKRDMWVFSVLVMMPFHKVEDKDETGQIKMNDRTGEPYTRWIQCDGRGCEHCKNNKETKRGHVQHWPMGRNHFNTLLAYAVELGKHCAECGNLDCVQDIAWVCQNPDCGEAVIDMTNTQLSDEDIKKITDEPMNCPACKHFDYLQDVYECSNCAKVRKSGRRASLFDVDLYVSRVEDPNGDSNATSLSITRFVGPKPIDNIYGKELREPLNLPKIYVPTSLERQISLFGPPPDRNSKEEEVEDEGGEGEEGGEGGENPPQRTPVNNARPYS
jgi:hypothetical protein